MLKRRRSGDKGDGSKTDEIENGGCSVDTLKSSLCKTLGQAFWWLVCSDEKEKPVKQVRTVNITLSERGDK